MLPVTRFAKIDVVVLKSICRCYLLYNHFNL